MYKRQMQESLSHTQRIVLIIIRSYTDLPDKLLLGGRKPVSYTHLKKHYQALATHYDDSLMHVLLPSSPLYLERRETREAAAGHPDEALSIRCV